jgi:hypothetical protein
MKTSIVRKDFLTSDEYIDLHSDSKSMYNYLLICPDKGYLDVFKFNKHLAELCTGLSKNSISAGINELGERGFIEIFNGYVGLLKKHTASVGGQYGAVNTARELASIPTDVREHFQLDDDGIMEVEPVKKTPKKTGPAPETIKDIIAKQHPKLREALQDFVDDRIERKKSPTTRAVKGWVNKLHSMYPNDHDKQAQVLYQSIERGWMGLFELKTVKSEEERAFM